VKTVTVSLLFYAFGVVSEPAGRLKNSKLSFLLVHSIARFSDSKCQLS
jgi:hypothetical protein